MSLKLDGSPGENFRTLRGGNSLRENERRVGRSRATDSRKEHDLIPLTVDDVFIRASLYGPRTLALTLRPFASLEARAKVDG